MTCEIEIFGMIGEYPNDTATILEQLRDHRHEAVHLLIDSPGGSFYDALSIHNAIRQRTQRTTAELGSLCASAATVIACGCDQITMPANGTFFVHKTLVATVGHANEHRSSLAWLEHADELLIQVYANKTGLTESAIAELIEGNGDGTALSAAKALRLRFVDKIISTTAKAGDRATMARLKAQLADQRERRLHANLKAALADQKERRRLMELKGRLSTVKAMQAGR